MRPGVTDFTAEEARALRESSEPARKEAQSNAVDAQLRKIFNQVKEAAEEGELSTVVRGKLFQETADHLRGLGYDVVGKVVTGEKSPRLIETAHIVSWKE